MCGIFGFSNFRGSKDDALKCLKTGTDSLQHRGPDDAGFEFIEDGGVGFGHRRLSILDLSPNGHQPMTSTSGRYVIVYNGEIYNFREIKDAIGDAYPFNGGSDTEVLLAAFERWGIRDSIHKFRGMFAFAVLDRKEAKLTLARDRMGIKPLYLTHGAKGFFFSSEIRALLKCGAVGMNLQQSALNSYLSNNFVAGESSLIEGVTRLVPGCLYEVPLRADAGAAEVIPYWDALSFLENETEEPRSPEAWKTLIHEKLRESVRLRMISDVPLGAFLSGGIDSSLIVALMQELSSTPVKTFTIGMEEREFDESNYAQSVATQLGCDHHNFQITHSEVIDKITGAGEYFDEPMADPSILPSLLVSEKTRDEVTVALTGDGGDEVFGGYNRHFHAPKIYEKTRKLPHMLRQFSSRLVAGSSQLASAPVVNRVLPYRAIAEKTAKIARVIGAQDSMDFYQKLVLRNPELAKAFPFDGGLMLQPLQLAANRGLGRQIMAYDLQYYMRYDILPKLDIASMRVSLEARVPLLDHELYELSCQLPNTMFFNGNSGKSVLKSILADYLDVDSLERPKSGFTIPLAQWLRGELKEWAYSILFDSRRNDYLDPSLKKQLWDHEMKRSQKEDSELWPLLMLYSWMDSFR